VNKRRRAISPRLNLTDLGEGMARPGNDTREWVCFGTVRGGTTEDDPCVEFEDDQPLVRVLLHPSLKEVRARVAMGVAGDGEADWHPFVPNDEVICVVAEGNERAGVVVVGRLSNAIDKFPSGSVAGQDPRKNAFAFVRRKAPRIEEHNGPVTLRSALTGGFIAIDDAGVLTLRGGNPGDPDAKQPAPGLQMGPDGISLQDASAKYALSFGPTSGALLALVGDAVLSLSSSSGGKPSMIGAPTSLSIGTAGNAPIEHVATTESVANILINVLLTLAAALNAGGPAPLTAPSLAVLILSYLSTGAIAPSFPAAASGSNILAASPLAASIAAIGLAFQAQPQKFTSFTGQLAPGIGCAGTFAG
jgi:hypothetical protein